MKNKTETKTIKQQTQLFTAPSPAVPVRAYSEERA